MANVADSEHRRAIEAGRARDGPPTAEVERLRSRLAEVKRELVALRDRLHLVGQAARIGLWEYDFEREVLHVSDELAGLYGLRPDEFTWADFVARLHPDDLVDELVRPTPSYPFGRPNEFLFRVRHRDGDYRTIRSRSVTHGQGDRPLRKLGIHIDVTDEGPSGTPPTADAPGSGSNDG